MKKYLIYLLIIIIFVGGFLTVAYFYPNIFSFSNKNNEAENANLSVNSLVNQVKTGNKNFNINVNLTPKKGKIEVNKSVTYKEVEFNILTADKAKEFEGLEAGENKTFVIVYLGKMANAKAADILPIVRNEIKLKSLENEYSVKQMNIVGTNSPEYAFSYLLFEVDENDKDFSLNFGSGDNLSSVSLGL